MTWQAPNFPGEFAAVGCPNASVVGILPIFYEISPVRADNPVAGAAVSHSSPVI
jgi:hypothetical protein